MCTCQPLEYHSRGISRAVPVINSYDRHTHPHYSTASRSKRYHADCDTYLRGPSAYTSTTTRIPLSSRRRTSTPPPVLIQSTPMGRSEVSPRLSPGGRFSRSGLDSPTSSIRSGEMGFNQPVVLQDGMGPVIHQPGSSHYQAPHNTGYAPHAHASGVRSAGGQRRYSVNTGGDRVRSSYIGYRSDHSVGSDEGYGSGRRMYTNEVRRSYGGRNSSEGLYASTPIRRYS